MDKPLYFQWQNDILCKTIYPMREQKLRDFLTFYMEVDIWKQYKNQNIANLKTDVDAYLKAQDEAAVTAYKSYKVLREYFQVKDVRLYFTKYKPIDEAELTQINNFHALFIDGWPKGIRGERDFVEGQIQYWLQHRNTLRDLVRSKSRRLENMAPDHPRRAAEAKELELMQNSR